MDLLTPRVHAEDKAYFKEGYVDALEASCCLFQLFVSVVQEEQTTSLWRQISSQNSLQIPASGITLSEFADPITDEFAEDFTQVESGL